MATAAGSKAGGGSGRSLRNFDVAPGPLAGPNGKPSLDKARQATGLVGKIGADKGALFIPKALAQYLVGWQFSKAADISRNLGGDPPRQDYRTIAQPVKPSIAPFQPDNQLSAARAGAINALVDALLDVQANGDAAVVSLDRYGGATEAKELMWASQQAAALLYYERQLGTAMITVADRLDAFRQVLDDEGVPDAVLTADDLRAYQDRLRTQGFTADEITAAHLLGLSNAQIEAARQAQIAADPAAEAGSLMSYLAEIANTFRQAGDSLVNPQIFGVGGGGSGDSHAAGAGVATGTGPSALIRLYEAVRVPIQVGNPLSAATTVDLRIRRVDLPPDWAVTVTPPTVTLAAGAQTTVTVSIQAGTAAVQGTQPRVAIEGFANGQLLDGVVIDVLLPEAILFDGKLRSYLPLITR
jgi:hypothetical protein